MSRKLTRITLSAIWFTLVATGSVMAGDDPSESVPTQIWNFGYVPQKSEVGHVFYLRNDRSGPLTVEEIKAGCSCTSVSEINGPIAPGDSAGIAVVFKSGRYSGVVKKTTKVFTDAPDRPEHHLKIAAEVIKEDDAPPGFDIQPSNLEWEIKDESLAVAQDSLLFRRNEVSPLAIALLSPIPRIIESITLPQGTIEDKLIKILVHPAVVRVTEEMKGSALTFSLRGTDTTIVTVPIELKD